jgi:putative ABC transport system permease protein
MAAEAHAISRVALRWMILGEWRAHPARVATAALAIAIGVALGFAVHLINTSALNEFSKAIRTVNGEADLQVHAVGPRGFDEALYPRLARIQGVAQVSPAVELPATLGRGADKAVTLIGLDPLRAALVTPSLLGRPAQSRAQGPTADDLFNGDAIFLSQAALDASGKRPGDYLELSAAGRSIPFVVAGALPGVAEGQKIAVTDIAAAQWRFASLGRLQRIDLRLAPGADPAKVRAAIAAALPPDAEIVSRETEVRRSDSLSRAYRVNLDMLALMALLTGGFLVYSAQSLSVARRGSQFALLRVLGVRRRALLGQVLIEGAVVGGIGAVAGLGLGLALADAALRFLGGDLGGGYFSGGRPQLIFAPGAAALFLVLGLACAIFGSLLPAQEAARAQPAVALKATGDMIDPTYAPKPWLALGLLAAGGLAALSPPLFGLPILGYVSMALLLAGGVAAMPWLARALFSPFRTLTLGVPALDLALKRLWGAPSQAAVALCGIVASTSLMIAMAVMVSSFRGSVEDWLAQILPGDLYLRVDPGLGGLDRNAQAAMAKAAGVKSIHFLRTTPLRLAADQPPVALVTRVIDRADAAKTLPLIGASHPIPPGAVAVWLSEPAAAIYHRKAGDRMVLPLVAPSGGKAQQVFIAGVWRDYARQQGSIAMDDADYTRLTGDTLRTEGEVTLAPGVPAARAIAAMQAALSPEVAAGVTFGAPAEIRASALRIFDRSFAVTYVLEAIAILVGLAGVAATFSAQTLARTKEFGMLRHVGVLRGQVIAILAAEGALLGAVGVVAGLGLGLVMSQVLIHVVNPQSFHWTMETQIPLPLFAGVAVSLVVAAAGTALLAGRRALSSDAVRAVREDW